MITTLLLLLVVAALIYWLVSCLLVLAFFRQPQAIDPNFCPPVSILKPLKGMDAGMVENFASFCRQDYPDFELIFGVADADDPAIDAVTELRQAFPGCRIRLVVTAPTYVNRKAGVLHVLAAEARHDILVASDSDVRVEPGYLRRVVSPLANPAVGLVTCAYRGIQPLTLTARLEALYMGATFLPSLLVARKFLAMHFAMGATVALRRADLARIGGFAAVGDYLADDYQIGARIADVGLRVHMSDEIVDIVLGRTNFRDQWDREVRWAQCSRVSRPLEYPGLLLTFSTPFALLYLVATGLAAQGWLVLGLSLLLRWLVAWLVTARTDNRALRPWLILLPIRDLLTMLVWLAGLVGHRVVWRGEEYLLQGDGRLKAVEPTDHRVWER
ncbi:MAG: bacteriohopanetetrol glucosamine biosynthesis glycosyltransferase HpnI [Anaerolineae bacterium]